MLVCAFRFAVSSSLIFRNERTLEVCMSSRTSVMGMKPLPSIILYFTFSAGNINFIALIAVQVAVHVTEGSRVRVLFYEEHVVTHNFATGSIKFSTIEPSGSQSLELTPRISEFMS